MNRFLKTFFLGFAVLAFFAFVAVNVNAQTTGDSDAYQCVNNQINTGDYQAWYNNHCISPTPSVSPTETPTLTPTPTETPSNPGNPGGPGDGRSDGRSDGLSSCPSCTQAPPIQAVLGLSTTSSAGNVYLGAFQLLAALGLSAVGFKFFKRNA